MAADDKTLKIAARLVCTDQWLVTHVDPAWSILQLKQYLLHKFCRDASDSCHNPRAIPVSPRKTRRRSLSPITFAAPTPRKAKVPAGPPTSSEESSLSDLSAEDDDDLDDDDITKAFNDAHRYKYNARPSTSSASESVTRLLSDGGPNPQAYILLTFSTTQILEDRFSLSWYGIHPDELLELHPTSVSFVSLQRSSLDAYIAPYFAARVWALRIVGSKLEGGPNILRKRFGEDDGTAEAKPPGARDKGKRKVAVEWKERWAIIHQGVFSLCKERHDTHSAFSAPVSSLLSIRDSAHFTLPLHSRRLRQKSSSPPASNVVCLKFSSSFDSRQRTFSNDSMSVSFERRTSDPSAAPSGSGGQSAWWRRGSRDVSSTLTLGIASSASILVGSGSVVDAWDSFARRGSRAGLDDSEGDATLPREKGKGKAQDDEEDSVWIVLDMLDSAACSHILRVLHRQVPPACHTTFLPSRTPSMYSPAPSPIIFSTRASTPPTPLSSTTPGPSSSFAFPQTPILSPKSVGPSPSPLPSAAPSLSSYPFPSVNNARASSPAVKLPTIDTSMTAHSPGVPYPSWRLSLVRNARRAGLGSVGRAMELVMFGDEDEDDFADIEDAEEDDDLAIEWARRTSSVGPSPIEPPPNATSPASQLLQPREQFMFPSRHASDPAFKSIPEEGPAPETEPDTPSLLEPAAVLEPFPRPHRPSHPLVDLTSLYSTERETLHDSDGSEAEWDGWVDALVAQHRQEALLARARARRDALVSPDGLDTVISGHASTVRPPGAGEPVWGTGWSSQFGGSRTSLSQSGTPEREHPDEEGTAWDLVGPSDGEVDVDTEGSSTHSSEPHTGPHPMSQRRMTTSGSGTRAKRPKNTAQAEGQGQTLSSYSSVDSLLRRTMRTNIKSIKNLSLTQAKRASMHVLFPSASKSDVHLDAEVPPRAASASPPPSQSLSRPSMTSMRSTPNVGTRPRPFSPLSSQLPGQQYDDEDEGEQEHDDADEHEEDVDVDDVEEEPEGDGYMDSEVGHGAHISELGHDPQLTGGRHPVPMPGMRMVPAGYTTFQHSSLYGRGQQGGQEEKTHAGIMHGQSMQKLPMGMGKMMTTVSSTVSVGRGARRGATR